MKANTQLSYREETKNSPSAVNNVTVRVTTSSTDGTTSATMPATTTGTNDASAGVKSDAEKSDVRVVNQLVIGMMVFALIAGMFIGL